MGGNPASMPPVIDEPDLLVQPNKDGEPTEAPCFFMHVPKTAGSTLIQALEQQFDEDEIAHWLYPFRLIDASPDFFERHRYFHGHVEYAVMRALLRVRPIALTMLRHPIEQYLSQFGNHKRAVL